MIKLKQKQHNSKAASRKTTHPQSESGRSQQCPEYLMRAVFAFSLLVLHQVLRTSATKGPQ